MAFLKMADKARLYTRHDMIEAYSELPPYPENRARLLQWFLARGTSGNKRDLYALAVSLAQFGLDTHDLVGDPAGGESLGQVRRRQLQVLAGDYFNGRFYELLSRDGGIEAIRLVSRAICEVNRLKAGLYEKLRSLRMTAEEYLDHLVLIRSELFMPLVHFMSSRDAERFPVLFRSLVRCEIISDELKAGAGGDMHYGFAFWHLLDQATPAERESLLSERAAAFAAMLGKYNINNVLEQMLDAQFHAVRRLAESFGSESLLAEVTRMLESLAVCLPVMKTAEDL